MSKEQREGEGQLTGKIIDIGEPRTISGKWQACDFVIQWDNGHKEQPVKLQTLSGIDKPNMLHDWQVGDTVTAYYNIRGSQSPKGQVFTNVVVWKIEGQKQQTRTSSRYSQPIAQEDRRVEDNYIPRNNRDEDDINF